VTATTRANTNSRKGGVGFHPTGVASSQAAEKQTASTSPIVRGWIFATWSKQHAHFELHLNYTGGGGFDRNSQVWFDKPMITGQVIKSVCVHAQSHNHS
jgi:hypothetical protein